MQITLTSDIETALIQYAQNQGVAPETLVVEILKEYFVFSLTASKSSIKDKQSLVDYLENHIGTLSSSEFVPGGAQMSKNCGKKFVEGLLKKRQQGKL